MPDLRVIQGGGVRVLPCEIGETLGDALLRGGCAVARPCGGRGVCGKCAVTATGALSPMNEAERRAGARLSCQTRLLGDCEVTLPAARDMAQIELDRDTETDAPGAAGAGLGAAVDLGTTTIALKLYDLATSRPLATEAAINPQTAVAADVMGRIGEALRGSRALLQAQAANAIEALLQRACAEAGRGRGELTSMVVAGNTTMLYLLTGRDPASLAQAPFQADCLFGFEDTLLGARAYYPACMHAFVGADVVCAALASGMCERSETAMLCDIGTNGEMALWKDGALYVASTAAGPAFEGAGIVMGASSVRGAIDRVWVEGSRLGARTIGGEPSIGLCGSGLIDAVAALLRLEQIDETGATESDRLRVMGGVYLYPQDIRAVQLAKAAIAAGMRVLLDAAGVAIGEVQALYIAGGFGSHLNLSSAAAIGLIPAELIPRARAIGNGSLAGASRLLIGKERRSAAAALAQKARHISLGGNPLFNEAYVDNMLFPTGSE